MEHEALDNAGYELDLQNVGDILRAAAKTMKIFNVYPKDNPIYLKTAAELYDRLARFFVSREELTLDIEAYDLLYHGSSVYHSDERTDNIALLLFTDGVRRLTLHKGLTQEELSDFIHILRRAGKADSGDEDDIVTLLWERNITNIGYTAAEDTLQDNLLIENIIADAGPETEAVGEGEGAAAVSGTPSPGVGTQEGGIRLHTGVLGIPLSEKEKEEIRHEAAAIDEHYLHSAAVNLFFEIMASEEDSETLPGMIRGLDRILAVKLSHGDFRTSADILRGIHKFSLLYEESQFSHLFDDVSMKAGGTAVLRALFASETAPEDVRKYLLLLDAKNASNMLELLGELQDRRQRRVLCEIIAEKIKNDVDIAAKWLDDKRWYFVRNLVMILGMTKNPGAALLIEKSIFHPDLRVRREAVKALEGIQSGEVKRILAGLLKDADSSVRVSALKTLRRFRDPSVFKAVRELSTKEYLKKKDFREKREILEALAATGGDAAMPLLSELFRKSPFMETEEITEIRTAAACGLAVLKSPEAVSLLEKGAEDKKQRVREVCGAFLTGIRKSGSVAG